jgi:hypothetical protein
MNTERTSNTYKSLKPNSNNSNEISNLNINNNSLLKINKELKDSIEY